MENTPKREVVQPKEKKQSNSIVGLLVGVVSFLFLLVILGIIFIFTDLGNSLIEKVQEIKNVESVEEKTLEEETPETEEVTLENEGWSLYSIPEYGFSVEIPGTSVYNSEFDQYMRWEVSRGKEYSSEKDSLDSLHINYYPSGFSPDARGCGQGCNGELQIAVYIYDKETQYNLAEVKIDKQEELDNWNGMWEEDEGYEAVVLEDYVKDPDPFNDSFWCVNLPKIADGNFRECYIETNGYLIEIIHTGLNSSESGTDSMNTELYNILKSMKFE
ncbi:MAG: hypothetical protein PHP08_03795 [Candidatus Dojkabacteria bacterium]|nr:hypothetical protein [Candidatus Dojkabacteria bacterium]